MAAYHPIADASEIPPGATYQAVVGETEIAIYNVDGELYATQDTCSHEEASLSGGELFGHQIECPLHGARFDIRTGKALTLPAVYPIKTYPVRVVDGRVEIEL
jgi:3-phenylpropionate/trans-cinnamate dioxygenase ferredoxin subunit